PGVPNHSETWSKVVVISPIWRVDIDADLLTPNRRIKVPKPVILFFDDAAQVVADSEVQSKVAPHSPVILHEGPKRIHRHHSLGTSDKDIASRGKASKEI